MTDQHENLAASTAGAQGIDLKALETCPLCGAAVDMTVSPWRGTAASLAPHVVCPSCGLELWGSPVQGMNIAEQTEQATAALATAWNRRAALPTEAPEPVALRNDPGRPVSMAFADGTVVYLTIEQGRRALAASLEAVNIPSTIDGAIKGMRVLRTMLDKEKLAGVEVADEIIAGLMALGRDPNARTPAPVSNAVPVAWIVERDGKTYLPFIRSREEMERYVKNNPDERLLALYASPQDRAAIIEGGGEL